MKKLVLVTGPPRSGKTTILLRVAQALTGDGYKIGGVVTQEIRERGVRVGFEIRDYKSGKKGWLAHVRQPVGPRVGRYRVNLDGLDQIGTSSILNASEETDLILVDEIGPMELFSRSFTKALKQVIDGPKPILGSIHYRAGNPLIRHVRSREDAEIFQVNRQTANQLPALITTKIIKVLRERKP